MNSEGQVKYLTKNNELLAEENSRLKGLLIKNEIDSISTK